MKIKRSQAAKLIEDIRRMCANNAPTHHIERMLEDAGIPPLTPCTGEAHRNAFIDNCMQCAPRWGLVGEDVTVS